jgi:hypothetical protein
MGHLKPNQENLVAQVAATDANRNA